MITNPLNDIAVQDLFLRELAKGIGTGDITSIVPQDLEVDAHNTLWDASKPNELTLMKLLPMKDAKQIVHEFRQITSYGETRGFGEFSEQTLPLSTKPTFADRTVNIRLSGEMTEVFLLASLEKTIRVEGETGADAIARTMVQLSLLRKINLGMYFQDTSVVRLGTSGLRYKGLLQQIREGTDGTVGTSPYGTHVIDLEGQPLTISNIRVRIAKIINLFGFPNVGIMDSFARLDFETSLDGAGRLDLPVGYKPLVVGQHVGGLQTNGGTCVFHTDNSLNTIVAQPRYIASAMDLAPSSPPSATLTVNASPTGSNESKFRAADAGSFFWIITEFKNGRESLGRRLPSSGAQAVAAGEEVAFSITPTDPLSDGFKVYRGNSGDANTEAVAIFSSANSGGGGAVAVYDLNHWRPNTSCAFFLSLDTEVTAVMDGRIGAYEAAKLRKSEFIGMPDKPSNTVTAVKLGPAMGTMNLATILPTTSRPMLYSARCMEVRNPLQQFVIINIGSAAAA